MARSGETFAKRQRVLITTLTKNMAEDLSTYFQELGLRVKYLHSDIQSLDRVARLTIRSCSATWR